MAKTLTVKLGGIDRTLDVGKFWFTKYFGEAAGSDPLNSTEITLMPEKQFDFVVNMVLAGMRTHCKVTGVSQDFNRNQVEDWVGELEDESVSKIIYDYIDITSVKAAPVGEVKAPAVGA